MSIKHDELIVLMSIKQGQGGSSTTKTGRHDIAEILLKVALKHQKINQDNWNIDQINVVFEEKPMSFC